MAPLTDPRAVRVTLQPSLGAPEAVSLVVEPSKAGATLRWLDAERAVLEPADRAGGDGTRVLVLRRAGSPSVASRGAVLRREVILGGWRFELDVEPAARAILRERAGRGREAPDQSGPTEVHAMIPGVVVSVAVVPGEAVEAGQQLLAIEAMKMQNELRAPRDGTIERIAVAPGHTIDVGDLLLVIGQEDA